MELTYKDGNLYLHRQSEEMISVLARPCFPWSEPKKFITLRDFDNKEVQMIEDPAELDEHSREALKQGLSASDFVFQIVEINTVDTEFEIRNWKVNTVQGKQVFQTHLDEWPRKMPGGGFLLRDVAGNLFYIPSAENLDSHSQGLLSGFIE